MIHIKQFNRIFFLIIFIIFLMQSCDNKKTVKDINVNKNIKTIKINNGIYKINLNTSISKVSKLYPIKEDESSFISLLRDIEENKEKFEKIDKELNRKFYKVSECLPENVDNIRLTTIQDIIYEIAIDYKAEYINKISWEIFIYNALKKYGQPIITNKLLTDNVFNFKWSDGVTELTIAKHGVLNDEKTIFTVKNYYISYTSIQIRSSVREKEDKLYKNMRIKENPSPLF